VRLSGAEIREPDAPAGVQRALRFEDGAAGSVLVIDARGGQTAGHHSPASRAFCAARCAHWRASANAPAPARKHPSNWCCAVMGGSPWWTR
jgi:hypothetical protein